jgi:hypothetical protein
MIIVFVEDRALKLFVEKLRERYHILCSPRMPMPEGGGWPEVLKKVRVFSPGNDYRVIGIIEGDVKEQAERSEGWSDVAGRIFVTRKSEVEAYLFEKKDTLATLAGTTSGMSFSEFKHFVGKDEQEPALIRAFSELTKQKCEEMSSLVDLIRGC